MKYIITENQMNRSIIKWLNSTYGDLRKVEDPKTPTKFYFLKDNKVIFDYNSKYNISFISPDISNIMDYFFELEENHKKSLLRYWIQSITNLNVSTVIDDDIVSKINWMGVE